MLSLSFRCDGFASLRRLRTVLSTNRAGTYPTNLTIRNQITDSEESGSGKNERKHLVQWTTEEGTVEFEAFHGELLRTAALRRRVVSPHNGNSKLINCRGLGTCGTCAVEIAQGGMVEPKDRNSREKLRLSFPPHNPDEQSPLLRLACQVQVHGNLEVTKRSGFWGQYGDLSPSSRHQTYFGDLEFLLDDKSPDQPS